MKIEYSIDTEVSRIIHTLHAVMHGYFADKSFLILPNGISYTEKYKNILLPDIPYFEIPRFYKRVYSCKGSLLALNIPKNLAYELQKKLYFDPNDSGYIDVQSKIQNVKNYQNEIINEISEVLRIPKNKKIKITLYPTLYGTGTSYYYNPKETNTIKIYVRNGVNETNIVAALVMYLAETSGFAKLLNWKEYRILIDWLMTKTTISEMNRKLFGLEYKIYTSLDSKIEIKKCFSAAQDFIAKIRLPTSFQQKTAFSIESTRPYFYKSGILNLSSNEKKLLNHFIQFRGEILSPEALYDIVDPNVDNFSLEAVAKSIQRLRTKLEANKVSGSVIQTVRNHGYVLVA